MAHPSHARSYDDNAAPATVPVPRFPGMDWPGGDEEVAQVPVALLLAMRGRCSCHDCCENFVALTRRARLRAV
jgi:hypothetical protein